MSDKPWSDGPDLDDWLGEEEYYELEPLALLDLAWPDGMQPGLSEPVALLINEERETEEIVSRAGFTFFTSVERLKAYVNVELSRSGVA